MPDYLFNQFCGQKVFDELPQVLSYHSLMEESHPAFHQSDDGRSAVSPQMTGQTSLVTQVHDTDANTFYASERGETALTAF